MRWKLQCAFVLIIQVNDKKNVQNVDSAKMRDFSHISKKNSSYFFVIFNFGLKITLKIESCKIGSQNVNQT